MRTINLLFVLLLSGLEAFGAHRVTLTELREQLSRLDSRSDGDVARGIAQFQLTERLDPTLWRDLERALPGEKSRQALRVLAAESQFLPPAASDIPTKPEPDFAAQRAIMGRVVAYISGKIPQLPNFLATRVTDQYEDTPLLVSSQQGQMIPYEPMHYVSTETTEVAYRDGRETDGWAEGASTRKATASGLATWGVFGPVLSMVLLDAAQSKLSWSHWEQGSDGVLAVFQYLVPAEKSHYEVSYCCVVDQPGVSTGGIELTPLGGHIQMGGASSATAVDVRVFRKLAAYEGEIAVDPETGAIRRLLLIANMKRGDPVAEARILVEYGTVEIGGRAYICPVRSISASRAQSVQVNGRYNIPLANQLQPLKDELADATFKDYHVFRAETRVLAPEQARADIAAPAQPTMPAEKTAVQAPQAAAAVAEPSAASDTGTPLEGVAGTNAAQPLSDEPMLQEQPVLLPAGAAEPEMTATDTASLPARAPLPDTGFALRTTTRLVEVAVVATDKHGLPVTDLKPSDLLIYDNGRPQKVKDFAQAGADVETAAAPMAPQQKSAVPEPVVTNRAVAGSAAAARQGSGDTTVLMIDAAHLDYADVTYARGEILHFLKTVPPDEHVGLYILGSHGFQVADEPMLDHAALAATLGKWMPSAQDLQNAQAEEQRNRQQFDWVHSVYDMAYVNGNGEGGSDPSMYTTSDPRSGNGVAAASMHPPDAELRPMGDRPEDFALHLLVGVGRHLAAIPGHKTLVWIASDNVLADWTSSMAGLEDNGNRFLDQISLRARETLNEAHVSIYPLDVSQVEGSGISASLANRNVTPMGYSDRDAYIASRVGDASPANKNGRDTARLNQDTHPIQPAFQKLAEATGGRALRRGGDIAAELSSIVADGRAAYLLSFAPDTQADGKYHTLTVKCLRKDVTLRYRNGYLYSEEPATMKDRLREVVWQPRDENEIGLTAALTREGSTPAVNLNIAATDLELAQQDGRWTDKLDVFLVVRDDSGLHATVAGKRLGLAFRPATYQRDMKDGLTVEEKLPRMPEGALLRLIVIDENSGRMGSVTLGTRE